MRLASLVGLFLLQSMSAYGAPVDKFSCKFQVKKDGAPVATLSSFNLYSPRYSTKFGPPVFEGKVEDPAKVIPGFRSTTSAGVTAGEEVDFHFSINVYFAVKKDGSAALQSSCIGQQATFHPAEGTQGLSLSQTDPHCGVLFLEPWNEDGSIAKGWNPTTLKDGAPVLRPE